MVLSIVTYWFRRFARSDRGRLTLKVARVLFQLGLLAYLGLKLSEIGWRAAWEALPTEPLFYLLFLLLYFSLPLTEMLIYRLTWQYPIGRSLPAFIKKRVYNKDVIGYAGEVYFFAWARKHVQLPDVKIAETVRDNNILSSVASTAVALLLLGIFLYVGHLRITDLIGQTNTGYLIGGAVVLALLIPVGLRFRKYIFSMALSTAFTIFGIQAARLVVGQVLQIAQWAVVMPEVDLPIWFTFAAVSIILTRIPFIPNQNLIFMGVGVQLSTSLGISEAAMFSMLGVLATLDKLLNFGLLTLLTFIERKKPAPAPETAPRAAARVEEPTAELEPAV